MPFYPNSQTICSPQSQVSVLVYAQDHHLVLKANRILPAMSRQTSVQSQQSAVSNETVPLSLRARRTGLHSSQLPDLPAGRENNSTQSAIFEVRSLVRTIWTYGGIGITHQMLQSTAQQLRPTMPPFTREVAVAAVYETMRHVRLRMQPFIRTLSRPTSTPRSTPSEPPASQNNLSQTLSSQSASPIPPSGQRTLPITSSASQHSREAGETQFPELSPPVVENEADISGIPLPPPNRSNAGFDIPERTIPLSQLRSRFVLRPPSRAGVSTAVTSTDIPPVRATATSGRSVQDLPVVPGVRSDHQPTSTADSGPVSNPSIPGYNSDRQGSRPQPLLEIVTFPGPTQLRRPSQGVTSIHDDSFRGQRAYASSPVPRRRPHSRAQRRRFNAQRARPSSFRNSNCYRGQYQPRSSPAPRSRSSPRRRSRSPSVSSRQLDQLLDALDRRQIARHRRY